MTKRQTKRIHEPGATCIIRRDRRCDMVHALNEYAADGWDVTKYLKTVPNLGACYLNLGDVANLSKVS